MTDTEQDVLSWWELARRWDASRRSDPARAEALLRTALTEGPLVVSESSGRPSPRILRECAVRLVRASDVIDARAYLDVHGLDSRDIDAIEHFCTHGWRKLLNPSPSFDVWWYWTEHLDPRSDAVNPLVHHLLFGRRRGLSPSPFAVAPSDPAPAPAPVESDEPRRVALFAVNDPDGLLDPTAVDFIRELSRYADVHVMAGTATADPAWAEVADCIASASSDPHGGGSPVSFAVLAQDVVGWETIARYDEAVLVDDSSYLVGSLRPLFDTARRSSAGVWTPQRLPSTPTWTVEKAFVPGATFVLLRRPVLDDTRFRAQFASWAQGAPRPFGAAAFWGGLAHRVHAAGHGVGGGWENSSGDDDLLREHAFDRIRDGVGLLRRELLVENPYDVPGLADWGRSLCAVAPDAPVEAIGRHLARVAPDDALRRSFAVTRSESGEVLAPRLMSDEEFRASDAETPTFDHWWAFPVCAYDHTFAGNERSVFEEVRDDPSIKKIILTRSRRIDVEGENVVIVPMLSPEGQFHLLRAGQVFVKHTPLVNVPFPLSPDRHNFINLWHGIPLKRFGYVAHDTAAKRAAIVRHHVGCRAVITSSQTDSLSMKAAFHPLTLDQMWPTGLPRNDFVVREESLLPEDLRAAISRLREEVAGRRLVMFLPTFKNDQAKAYYEFSEEEISWLADWCLRENAVIGVREHMADTAHTYSRMLAPLQPIHLSSRRFPDLEVLYRVAAGLVTDYSSCVVDFLLTGKPVVSFAYDYEHYTRAERGLFYDLEKVLPGPVARDFAAFASALDSLFAERTVEEVDDYAWRRGVFFDHLDDRNGERVVERVKALYVEGILSSGPA